jgi:hypothetical protein
MKEISEAEIQALLSRPKRGSTKRSMNLGLKENRNVIVWFKLPMTFAYCSNPECPDDRPRKTVEGNAMCTLINDKPVCRLCFLAGFALDKPAGV